MNSPPLRSLKRNYFFSALSAVLGILYPVVTLAYVARVMGPEALGKYYIANSLAVYFLFAACLGIPVYGAREIGRAMAEPGELRRVFSQLFLLNAAATVFFTAVYVVVIVTVPQFRAELALFGIFGLLVLNNLFTFEYLYAGLERQDQLAYRSLLSKIVSVVLIVVLIRDKGDYLWFAAIAVFSAMFNSALALKGMRYWGGFRLAITGTGKNTIRAHLRPIFLIALSMLFVNVYINLDSVLLGLMTDPHEVGLYSSAMRPTRLVAVLLATMLGAALPRLAYYASVTNDPDSQRLLKQKSMGLIFLLALPISISLMLGADSVIALLYGPEFAEASSALMLASPLLLLNCLATFHLIHIAVPLGKEYILVTTAVVGAIVSVGLNVVLIPVWGYQGAVLTALAAEIATILVQIGLIRRTGSGLLVLPAEWKKILSAGLLLGGVQLAGNLSGLVTGLRNQWILWILSTIAYLIVLWMTKETLTRQAVGRIAVALRIK